MAPQGPQKAHPSTKAKVPDGPREGGAECNTLLVLLSL